MSQEIPLFVARFISHPLGQGRYAKDFRHNLTRSNAAWWENGDEVVRLKHFVWALNHPQYHYSTADLQQADLWHCNDVDAADREILARYAPVEFVPVSVGVVDQAGDRDD